jgi:hypothetical protein
MGVSTGLIISYALQNVFLAGEWIMEALVGREGLMNHYEWVVSQLQSSAEGFERAFWSVPGRLRREMPIDEKYMGRWPAARHVWHVTEYERIVALSNMRVWTGEEQIDSGPWLDDDDTWLLNSNTSDEVLIERYCVIRRQELDKVKMLRDVDWNERRDTGWGQKSLAWVLTKTIQHTWEHGDTLMRMSLWWEHIQEQIALAHARKAGAS